MIYVGAQERTDIAKSFAAIDVHILRRHIYDGSRWRLLVILF